jgi:hypothetical protein
MSRRWTLYWVSSDTIEDCFVAARSSRSAARVEIDMNGFDPEWVKAERICVIPKTVEEAYFHKAEEEVHQWPWYVYGRAFFEGVGAEFREIEGQLQMLLNDVVYEVNEFSPCEIRRIYTVGARAANQFDAVPEFKSVETEYEEPDYLGSIAPFVHEIVGRCLLRCQRIESNLASSFIFCAPQENKPEGKTINDLRNEWKRLTFGQLVKIIKKNWDMAPELEAAFNLFKESRNLFIHRLCTDPRYDISTKWGVMEFLPFLQFFELQTKLILRASEASMAASVSLALHQFGTPDGFDFELFEEEHDENVGAFFHMFHMKGEPWPDPDAETADSENR